MLGGQSHIQYWYTGLTNIPVRDMDKVQIKPIARKSLPERIAGKLAASIIGGNFKPESQLPSERELVEMLDISRSTLREALKILAEHQIIEARPGVGWFACKIDENNVGKARQLARQDLEDSRPRPPFPPSDEPAAGPRRLPSPKEKPLKIPNLKADRLGTFDFISWWERDKVEAAKILVVGAGALGNEVIKNLALMGVGHIFVIDFDEIEFANLSRSVLFRESDPNRQKAEVAAARAKEINPNIHVQYLHGDVTTALGLGIFRRMDVIIGCLDNREARLAINRYAHWMNKPWIDGAIQELLGLMRVFVPGDGACYECTLTADARRDLAVRYSCPLLARQNVLMGKVPTTPTIASIIAAMQCQEALKLIHDMPVEAGKVTHFNGLNNHMHTTAYVPREDCESHWIYGEVIELPLRADSTTLQELLQIAKNDLGPEAAIELDQELVLSLECTECNKTESLLQPMSEVSFEAAHCPTCGNMREVNLSHMITGEEDFLQRTLSSVGIPPLHIIRANNGIEYYFYELTGDEKETLHFSDFEDARVVIRKPVGGRIRIGEKVKIKKDGSDKKGTIKLLD
jgi:molybdopterin/thiamine biosynthesis adenylyltransferase/DNA-binding transcriptional regulator YhcF (GntR family)